MSDHPLPQSPDLNPSQIRMVWTILIVAIIGVCLAFLWKSYRSEKQPPLKPLPVLGQLPDFSLIERSGKEISLKNLSGKIWVADFIFTRCAGPCPTMSLMMGKMQPSFKVSDDIRLVSVTVDPEYDSPAVLTDYAKHFVTKPDLWLFLTGKNQTIRDLALQSFKLPLGEEKSEIPKDDSTSIIHSTHFVLVDGKGRIRGYYDSSVPGITGDIVRDAKRLLSAQRALPGLNAILNSASTILLILAYRAVRKKRFGLHRNFMYAALLTSAAFLASYLTHHFTVQLTKHYEGPLPQLYFTILASHTVLAILVLPMVLTTVFFALKAQKLDPQLSGSDLKKNFSKHARLARWTFPVWLYVSFTGVVVYLMLYQIPSWLEK